MGYNIAGLVIDTDYNQDIKRLSDDIGILLEVVDYTDFETASANWVEGDDIFVYFSTRGTMVFFANHCIEYQWHSKAARTINYAYSATSMAFYLDYYEGGTLRRSVMEHEGGRSHDTGDPLPQEKENTTVDGLIMTLMDELLGSPWQSIDHSAPVLRCRRVVQELPPEEIAHLKKSLSYMGQQFMLDISKKIGPLDYTLDSLTKVEHYIQSTIAQPGKPNSKSYFGEDTEQKILALGCYIGEVIRRSGTTGRWVNVESDDPTDIAIQDADGQTALVINKAFKRVYQGAEDNLTVFARMAINMQLQSENTSTDHFDETDHLMQHYQNSSWCIIAMQHHGDTSPIVDAMYQDGSWALLTADAEPMATSDEVVRNYLWVDALAASHPDLHRVMMQHTSDTGSRIRREQDGHYRYQKAHKGILFDSSSMAAFQGNMQLEPLQWIKMNTATVLRNAAVLLVSLILMTKVHWVFALLFVPALLYTIWYWLHAKNTFGGGNVGPGKVISVDPDIIAVVTDLSKGYGGAYPTLKIKQTTLSSSQREIGTYLPVVSIYNDNPHGYPFWSEFHPVPVTHGITDPDKVQYFIDRFTEDDYDAIDQGLLEINTREIGTYKLQAETTGWADYTHVDINKGVHLEGPPEDKA